MADDVVDPPEPERPKRVLSNLPVKYMHVVSIGDDPNNFRVFTKRPDALAEIRNLWVNERVPARHFTYERVDPVDKQRRPGKRY